MYMHDASPTHYLYLYELQLQAMYSLIAFVDTGSAVFTFDKAIDGTSSDPLTTLC